MTIRIVVADDHLAMRASVCSLLRAESDLEIVGEAADGSEAVEMSLGLKPDIVLMDVAMPKLNGIEATRRVRESRSEIRILMMSMHGSPAHAEHALAAGADGFLLKADVADEVVKAVRKVCAGERYFSRQLNLDDGPGN